MSDMLQQIVKELKERLPGAVATGIFSVTDGLMLAVASDVPETDMDAMSAIHSSIWEKIRNFLDVLPSEIVGNMQSMILETDDASFYIVVDKGMRIALMAAVSSKGNLGMLRLMSQKYLEKVLELIYR